jgi:hypothetical protein
MPAKQDRVVLHGLEKPASMKHYHLGHFVGAPERELGGFSQIFHATREVAFLLEIIV